MSVERQAEGVGGQGPSSGRIHCPKTVLPRVILPADAFGLPLNGMVA